MLTQVRKQIEKLELEVMELREELQDLQYKMENLASTQGRFGPIKEKRPYTPF